MNFFLQNICAVKHGMWKGCFTCHPHAPDWSHFFGKQFSPLQMFWSLIQCYSSVFQTWSTPIVEKDKHLKHNIRKAQKGLIQLHSSWYLNNTLFSMQHTLWMMPLTWDNLMAKHCTQETTLLTALHPEMTSSVASAGGLIEAFFLQMYPWVFSHMWSAHLPSFLEEEVDHSHANVIVKGPSLYSLLSISSPSLVN